MSITTISSGREPRSISSRTALRPFVPKPTTTMWLSNAFLQRCSWNASRERCVSTWIVVPTSTRTKSSRIGVTSRALTSRALCVTGVMSPYPVVVSVTVV